MNPPDDLPWREIVSHAVHDLGTPLSAMRTSLEILRLAGSDPETAAKMIGLLEAQIDAVATQIVALRDDPGRFLKG